jgi:anaerobic selenocysteine-containing dehydrogenase
MALVRSVCPYDCPDACGLTVEVHEGRAVAVRGDPEHPYSRGTVCSKMNHYERTVHSPDRLTRPLVRTGAKGEGSFRPATWDEAIGIVAERLRGVIAAHGAEAILPYSYAGTMGLVQRNAGHPFFHALGASRLDRTICSPAKDAGWQAIMGKTPGLHPDEVLEADLVILWSINAVATSVHFAARAAEARRRGAKVWLVDTYANDTAAMADRVILVRPGSDGALALGMLHVIARDGLADERFLAAETVGWPELRARVLADYPIDRVAAITGLAPPVIEELAREYASARAPFIRLGGGLTRYGNSAMTVRTLACLPAAVGAWDRKGGGLMHQASGSQAFDLAPLTREDLQPRATRIVNMNRLGHALGELGGPRVMALYVYASNPAAVAPDQGAVLRGLAREDLFLCVHERFLTDTARYADVLLPATSSLEHPDLYRSYGHYAIQRARAAIPPVGEAKSNWEVFALLARAMGLSDPLFGKSTDEVIDLLLSRPSPWREGLDRARLDAGHAVELARPPGPRWGTPSGRIELLAAGHREPLPRWLPTHSEDAPQPLWLVTGCNRFTLNSTFMEQPELRERAGGMVLKLGPGAAAARRLADGDAVTAWNEVGEARFTLRVSEAVPDGVAVAEGVWWLRDAPGSRNVNALCAPRLTDEAGGSTFYDNRIDVRRGS